MEDALRGLVDANSPERRADEAWRWKRAGKRIVGLFCPYVPEEIIYAAGMLPWRVTGTWNAATPHAAGYWPAHMCQQYAGHVLESFLNGELDFLDGIVVSDCDDTSRRLVDVLAEVGRPPFRHLLHVPHHTRDTALAGMSRSIVAFRRDLEAFAGATIGEDALAESIALVNRTRALLGEVYELRRRAVPALSGAEALGITTAAMVLPKEQFNEELARLLPYLAKRQAPIVKLAPRVLVCSDQLDNPAIVSAIEGLGCLVAMDDMDTGSRYGEQPVCLDAEPAMAALARRYLTRSACPRMFTWDDQMARLARLRQDYRIDGVLNLPYLYSYWRQCFSPYLRDSCEAAGIPFFTIEIPYGLENIGQLQTRAGAFIEMLEAEAAL